MDFMKESKQIKILLLEAISDSASNTFATAGFTNIEIVPKALDRSSMSSRLKNVSILGIRSRSKLDEEIIDSAGDLLAIGCFSVGTNQVDLNAAQNSGIPVFNAPFSNTRSVAELTISEVITLFRRTFSRSMAAHSGKWDKSSHQSYEIRGKTLGVVGYGNIGTQVAVLAEAMGMRVIYYDHTDKLQHGNVEPVGSLRELLEQSDVVSLHVPETLKTKGMIGKSELNQMKKTSYLINNARGSLVDLEALSEALKRGHIAGAAIDVFPNEPSSNSETFTSNLNGLDNVVLTPHIGGSTNEAQERIGVEVARKLIEYIDSGSTTGAVNFPNIKLDVSPSMMRFMQVHRNVPGELRRLNDVFSRNGINILSQQYKVEGDIGYVVLDIDSAILDTIAEDILREVRMSENTIRANFF